MKTRMMLFSIWCVLPMLAAARDAVVTTGAATNVAVVADAITVDPATGNMTLTGDVQIRRDMNPPKGSQIQIRAKLIESKPGGGEEILSAPQVIALSGQEATITVGQEVAVPPDGKLPADFPSRVMTVEIGVKLRITATQIGKDLLLQGRMSVEELAERKAAKADPEVGKVAVVSREVTFNLVRAAGTPVVLSGLDGDRLRLELVASVLPVDNAAPVYWQAFAALPDRPAAKEGPGFEAWLKESERALQLLHTAAAKDGCDWNLDLSKGPELELSHLSKARALASAALARASRRAAGDAEGAISDLVDALRLSRHLGTDPVLICQLVRGALEKQGLEQIEQMRPKLTSAQASRLAEVLASLRPAPTLAECVRVESATFLTWLRVRLGAGDVSAIQTLGAAGGPLDGMPPDALLKMLKDVEADYAELARMSELPQDQFVAAYEPWEEKLKADRAKRPLSSVMMPAWGSAGRKMIAIDADLARMLDALRQMSDGVPK